MFDARTLDTALTYAFSSIALASAWICNLPASGSIFLQADILQAHRDTNEFEDVNQLKWDEQFHCHIQSISHAHTVLPFLLRHLLANHL